MAYRDVEPDQAAQRVADEVAARGAGGVEHGQRLVRHGADAVVSGQLATIPAGACLVVGDDTIVRLEGGHLRRPVGRGSAEA